MSPGDPASAMSSPVASAPPVSEGAKKKARRPSFRPSSNRKPKKAPANKPAEPLSHPEESTPVLEKNYESNDHQNAGEAEPATNTATLEPTSLTAGRDYYKSKDQDDFVPDDDLSPNKKQKSKPTRKRKTTVLAVGSSRQTTPSSSTALVAVATREKIPETEATLTALTTASTTTAQDAASSPSGSAKKPSYMPMEMIPPVIPENTTGKPTLTAYCTAFPKPKRKKKNAAAAGAATVQANQEVEAAAQPEQELPPQNSVQHAGPVVQIVNGEIVLQESSVIFQGSGAAAGAAAPAAMTVVEEEAQLAVVGATYTSFATGRRARTKAQHWSVEETRLFYEALRQVGLDFGTMEAYFENTENENIRKRTRRQLKQKYKAEQSKNPTLIEGALQPAGRVEIGT